MPAGPQNPRLLGRWRDGDDVAPELLSPYIYDELRKLAASHMRREKPGHTLQATALVNEAFLCLAGVNADFASRKHFQALCSRLMRRIFVDHARSAQRAKRGDRGLEVTPNESVLDRGGVEAGIPELVDALTKRATFDER